MLFLFHVFFVNSEDLQNFVQSSSEYENTIIVQLIKESNFHDQCIIFENLPFREDWNFREILRELSSRMYTIPEPRKEHLLMLFYVSMNQQIASGRGNIATESQFFLNDVATGFPGFHDHYLRAAVMDFCRYNYQSTQLLDIAGEAGEYLAEVYTSGIHDLDIPGLELEVLSFLRLADEIDSVSYYPYFTIILENTSSERIADEIHEIVTDN